MHRKYVQTYIRTGIYTLKGLGYMYEYTSELTWGWGTELTSPKSPRSQYCIAL